ncbi:helix-turn-helix domain-containing protein [Oricola sp.]|uniref:helix-turn-helix domain-containing protein n=1 Tax=Oricola sp. TaxID=1979950 RepID=UPI0025D1F6B1|nr:helix-turn-helix domain-containing protein [Oricola sp.]
MISSFDTRSVAKSDRIDFWEERCSSSVVGLTCSTTEENGFEAKFDHYDFGSFSAFDIAGRPHVICRSSEMVRRDQKDSVFFTIIMKGNVFVNRRDRIDLLNTGDIVLYDTTTPYMHGFPTEARQVLFDVPGGEFRKRFPEWDLRDALKIDGNKGTGIAIGRAMRNTFSKVRARKYLAPEPMLINNIWSALEMVHDHVFGSSEISSYHFGIIQRVRTLIRSRIDDPNLDTETVSVEIGMSSRQLNRILAVQSLTVRKLIQNERLDRAHRVISGASGGERFTLTELAYNCGYSCPSHFSKSFRRRFGVAPSEMRVAAQDAENAT